MSIRLSVRMEQLGSNWTDFMKFDIWVFSKNPSKISSFIKIWQEWQALYINTYVHLW
jgi:hypothetical protein